MANYSSISTNIPNELNEKLEQVSKLEERSKSYYVKKGLELVLNERLENLADYIEAKEAYEAFINSKQKAVSLEEVFKNTP